jgi:GrpB-like predicted nucleotidyltransferase (UPF0157 family)
VTQQPEVSVVGWDPQWPALARAEAARLLDVAPAVEHVGSTAVPGLVAIPVIDLVVGVDAAERNSALVATAIEGLGYRPADPSETIGRLGIHLRQDASPPLHVWVVEARGHEWKEAIAVRD